MKRREFTRRTVLGTLGFALGCTVKNRFDVLIKNGIVYNGSGAAGLKTNLGIKGGSVIAIDPTLEATADRIIDASNLAVAPGFIDIHAHTDTNLIVDSRGESKIMQGVTTEICGNCGSTPFPLNDADFESLNKYMQERYQIEISWRDTAGYLSAIEQAKPALNFLTLTGQGDLRAFIVGKNDIKPTTAQIKEMQQVMSDSMEQGSFGLSSGLEYAPGSYAGTEELIEICRTVAEKNGVYATHMRNEDDTVFEAIDEALHISRESGVNLQIAHLKAANPANWHKVEQMLIQIHQARDQGVQVHADRYPYIAYGTGMTTFLPLWARQGSRDDILARLEDSTVLPKIKEYTESRGVRIGGWTRFQISYCNSEKNKRWEGQSIEACAEAEAKSPSEFIRSLLIEENLRAGIVGFAMDESNLQKILADPLVMIGSDGSAVSPSGKLSKGKPHPRFYGTFPRVLGKYAREEQIFDLGTAIKKMTSMPAEKMGINKRGRIEEGFFADLVIFEPHNIKDKATFTNPHQFPHGIQFVLVNGVIAVENGKHTGATAGRVLRHQMS